MAYVGFFSEGGKPKKILHTPLVGTPIKNDLRIPKLKNDLNDVKITWIVCRIYKSRM